MPIRVMTETRGVTTLVASRRPPRPVSSTTSFTPARRKYSLEYDLFPGLKDCYGFKSRAALLDIGVPERYRTAGKILKRTGLK